MSRLIYFPVYGRGEKVRILLAYAGIDHVDERLPGAQFGPRKAAGEFPNGQLPVWVQNGKYYNESSSILRFLGKQHGFYPNDVESAYITDNAVDFSADITPKLYPDHAEKKFEQANIDAYVKNIEHFAKYFNKILAEHGKHFIAGDELTIGDFAIAAVIFSYVHNDALAGGAAFSDKGKAVIAQHDHFHKYVERLQGKLAANYLSNRPPASF